MKFFQLATLSVLSLLILASCNGGKDKTQTKDSSQPQAEKLSPGSSIKLDSSKRYIYLTWDDSPQPPGTVNAKAVFRNEGIKATFFAVGFNQVGPWKTRVIDSLRNEYPQFLLANHSYSHGFNDKYSKFYAAENTDTAYNDFMRNEKDLKIPVKIIRLPGNNTWATNGLIEGQKKETALVKRLDAAGYKIVGWDMEWSQKSGKKEPRESADDMIKYVNQKFEEGSTHMPNTIVILSHDRLFEKKQFSDSLLKFIQVLKQDKRNVFETIDHYPTVQK